MQIATKVLLLAALYFLSLSACEDFLEEDPQDIITPSNFFNTESDARQAVTGVYAIYKNNALYGQLGLYTFYENGADVIGPNRGFGVVEPICNYTLTETSADQSIQLMGVLNTWKDLYKVVLNANILLAALENNDRIIEEVRTELRGEALFLRALAYYHLTNLWGDVPYYRDALPIGEIARLGRTDKERIRQEILSDLQIAQNTMPTAIAAVENGRASRWAAACTMAKIFLIQENWQAARDKCVEIIEGSPHRLLPSVAEVFDPLNEYNAEVIWELDFEKNVVSQFEQGRPDLAGNGNWFASMFNPRLRDEPKNTEDRTLLIETLDANGEAFTGTGLQIPLPDLINNFPERDLRRPLTVQDAYEGIPLSFPYMPKMWNLSLDQSPRFNHSDNTLIYRLADVYLMAAEAENELNGPAEAYDYLHAIRLRAYESEADWRLENLSTEAFRQAVRDERKWELAGEGHRRMDLIRWGILLETVAQTEYRVYNPAENIQPYHVLLPIPQSELILNPALLESDPTNNGYR